MASGDGGGPSGSGGAALPGGAAVTTADEDAADLVFPKEFEDPETRTLLTSEVKHVLHILNILKFN